MKKLRTTGFIALLVFLFGALFSIQFLDKPLALFIHEQGFDQWFFPRYITEDGISVLLGISLLSFLLVPTHKQIIQRLFCILYFILALVFAEWIRVKLGIICGRAWPTTWSGSGIYGSLVGDNHFGFHFFQSDSWKGSFPSGHTIVTGTICCSLHLIYPKLKAVWMIPMIILPLCLILENYHFLGDILAGTGLSIFISYWGFAGYLWIIQRYSKRA